MANISGTARDTGIWDLKNCSNEAMILAHGKDDPLPHLFPRSRILTSLRCPWLHGPEPFQVSDNHVE